LTVIKVHILLTLTIYLMSPITEKQKKGIAAFGILSGLAGVISGVAYYMKKKAPAPSTVTAPAPAGGVGAEVTGEVYVKYTRPRSFHYPQYVAVLPDGRTITLTENIVGIRYVARLVKGTPPVYATFTIYLNNAPALTSGDYSATFSSLGQEVRGAVETKIPPGLDGTPEKPTLLSIMLEAKLMDAKNQVGTSRSNTVTIKLYEVVVVPPEVEISIALG